MRYIPNTGQIFESMLKEVGFQSTEELFSTQIPKPAQFKGELALPLGASELELRNYFKNLADKNFSNPQKNFCGAGIYFHYVPSIVDNLSSRSEYLTCYTPYQAEISQGTLRHIFEFQTYLSSLTKMEVANASLYDGSTAFAEAVLMAKRIYPQRKNVLISKALHPEYKKVAITSTNQFGLEFLEINTLSSGKTDLRALSTALDNDTLAVCLQSPNFFGVVEDLSELSKILKPINLPPLSVVVIAEAMSLALYEPPGSFDVDIVCGETQSFGNYPGFGGPGVGFFTTKEKYVRNMPGRVVGQTLDGQGKIAFCLTLATREQHIRREKATSNICTNQGWCALRSTIYLSTMGSTGLREAAEICYSNAHYAAEKLCGVRNIKLAFAGDFFNEFVIEISDLNNRFQNALNKGIVPGIPLSRFGANPNQLLVTTTELHTKQNLDDLVESLGE